MFANISFKQNIMLICFCKIKKKKKKMKEKRKKGKIIEQNFFIIIHDLVKKIEIGWNEFLNKYFHSLFFVFIAKYAKQYYESDIKLKSCITYLYAYTYEEKLRRRTTCTIYK